MVNRVKTGIREFDEMLHGGFLEGDSVMLAGSTGTGKTTLALEYVTNGIKMFGENGIFVTFEQLPDQIYRDAMSFGWDLRKMEEEDKLRVVATSPDLLLQTSGKEHLLDGFIAEVHPRRIVIDSLSHLLMYVKPEETRKEIYRLIMYLKTKRLSSVLTWEVSEGIGPMTSVTNTGSSFLVDSVVLLKPVEIESSMKKALTVLKLRGSDHDKTLREFEITATGIQLKSPFADYEGLLTGSPRRTSRTEEAVGRFTKAFKTKTKTVEA